MLVTVQAYQGEFVGEDDLSFLLLDKRLRHGRRFFRID